MIFTHLQLKNFKSHLNTSIDFKEGISMILGENGAGKSSIFEAISFALYKEYTGTKIDDLVRTNKDKKDEKLTMSVALNFISNGIEYKIIRERASNKTKARLLRKDTQSFDFITLAQSDKEVNKEIENILEMDGELFLNAIYIRQEEIADLIDKTPAKRKEVIGKLLKLEELEKAWQNTLDLIGDYETRKAELSGKISTETEIDYDLKNKLREKEALTQSAKEAEEKQAYLKEEKDKNLKAKIQMDTLKSNFEALKNNLSNEKINLERLFKEKEELHHEIDQLNNMERDKNILKKYSDLLPIYIDFKEAKEKLSHLKEEELNKKQTIENIRKYENIIELEESSHEKYLALESQIKAHEKVKLELESDIKILSQTKENKENTLKEIQINKKDLNNFGLKINKILRDFDIDEDFSDIQTDEDFKNLKNRVEGFRRKINEEINSNQKKVKTLQNESTSLNTEIKSVKKPLAEIQVVENQCPVCKSEISPQKKEELISSYEETISSNTDRINQIATEIKAINKSVTELTKKSKDLEVIERDIYGNRHIADNLTKNIIKVADLDKKLVDFEDKNKYLNEINETIKAENKEYKELEIHNKNFVDAQNALKFLPKEFEIKNDLYSLTGQINHETERINKDISKDTYLSINLPFEDLNSKIEDYTLKSQRYHELTGIVKRKENVEHKLDEKNKEIALKKESMDNIRKDIESAPYNDEEYLSIQAMEVKINEKISINDKNLGVANGRLSEIIPLISSLEEDLRVNKIYKKEYDTLEKYINLLTDIRSLYGKDGIQKMLRARSKPVIQKYTKEFFEEFNFNYSNLILDDEYNIILYGPEGEAKIDMISGGEKIAVALALRLGITQAMSSGNIETILLDEPTIHLDSPRRHELLTLLQNMSVLPQMIIVTHDIELESAADNIIKVKKENGISSIELED